MLTYAVLGLLWGLITYDLPGDASSIFSRMMVSIWQPAKCIVSSSCQTLTNAGTIGGATHYCTCR